MDNKIAFVTPWYGENIPGGAESALRNLVKHLAASDVTVEILTTCVKEFASDWSHNYHTEGLEIVNNISVRRFKVRKRNTTMFDKVNYKLMNNIPITTEEEKIFFDEMIHSDALVDYIKQNNDAYHCFVFMPYMFGTTFAGIKACRNKAFLIPCLHDESYAYMNLIKNMFEEVNGLIFLAFQEYELANKLYELNNVKTAVLGLGVDTEFSYEPTRFKEKYGIYDPFILYAGRKDKGKNIDLLIEYFDLFKRKNKIDIHLVLIGGGEVHIPQTSYSHVHDLGFLPIQDKYDAYAAATVLCQPSINESFSIVIMESWIAERPVLVHNNCDVTRQFAISSNGGLYFSNYDEFEECILFFMNNKETSNHMGKNGKKFVLENFSWDIITEKYKSFFTV